MCNVDEKRKIVSLIQSLLGLRFFCKHFSNCKNFQQQERTTGNKSWKIKFRSSIVAQFHSKVSKDNVFALQTKERSFAHSINFKKVEGFQNIVAQHEITSCQEICKVKPLVCYKRDRVYILIPINNNCICDLDELSCSLIQCYLFV